MTEPRDGLARETSVDRVALTVSDVADVAEFYDDVVGLTVHDRTVLGDGEAPPLVLVADPSAPERPRSVAGPFHTAFRVPTRAALGDALARIEAAGRLTGSSDHHVSEALYGRDPEQRRRDIP